MSAAGTSRYVLGWGNGYYGRLAQGRGDWDDKPYPVVLRKGPWDAVLTGKRMTLAAGAAHVMTVTDGVLASHGKCHFGQLGLGMIDEDESYPVQVALVGRESDDDIVAAYAGESSGFARTSSGQIWAWGCGFYFGLGDRSEDHALVPRRVDDCWREAGWYGDGREIVDIAGGGSHIAVLCSDGIVVTGGGNQYGQTGRGRDERAVALDEPVKLPERAVAVAASRRHTLVLGESGAVYSAGEAGVDVLGRDGDGRTFDKVAGLEGIKHIALGPKHGLAASDDAVYSWGAGLHGRLGHGDHCDVSQPTRIVFEPTMSGHVVGLAVGSSHSLVLTSSGELWSWGSDVRGKQLFRSAARD
ncbi:BNR repeat domain-containing protein [Thecamonas trahens ATCC 50062]|uniref:BNR repeat domain-containing protein n=1 Tax=Thecamonas trahens ATCC 50062 TaxID=461836 RepID=A0A0L0D160_THETB|nr:BNR repeat domain-containing protein [Thecamonas trahens ATCC 50062]KNC45987.1 BNR repeat domain-containing protein [Thecamonas trahens ATCC 50062]|eukprot:XP_013762968.1 BNR repeat domain-containing protein [Thecamonas trahens ATCC 50062]